jgi:hypothetical protein
LLLLAGCAQGTAVKQPTGNRWLAITPNPRTQPTTGPQDLVHAVDLVYEAGARAAVDGRTWSSLEPGSGRRKLDDLKSSLEYLGGRRGLILLLGLQVINTTARETPTDLAGLSFDSAPVRARFHALIDALKPMAGSHLKYLSIGNEVDVYLAQHPDQWAPYKAFFDDAVAYVHGALPGVRVGVTFTFEGARGAGAAKAAELSAASDVYILTYYPLGASFRPRPPSTAGSDIARMVELARGRALLLQEVGYPAAAELGSSEPAQAEFVKAVLDAWQQHAAAIPLLAVVMLHDMPADMCATLAAYYGLPRDAAFKAYLCSLGLRRADGTPKPAWTALTAEVRATGLP